MNYSSNVQILDPVDALIQATTDSTLPLEPEDWIDWESWQPREKIAQLASAYKAGYDKEGLPGNSCLATHLTKETAQNVLTVGTI